MVLDLKTYFVVNRSPKAAYLDNSLINVANSPGTIAGSNQNISKVGSPDLPFTARMKDDLRHIDSSEIEYEVDRIEQHEKSKLTGNLSVSEKICFIFSFSGYFFTNKREKNF